jgi:hypothetical protein
MMCGYYTCLAGCLPASFKSGAGAMLSPTRPSLSSHQAGPQVRLRHPVLGLPPLRQFIPSLMTSCKWISEMQVLLDNCDTQL